MRLHKLSGVPILAALVGLMACSDVAGPITEPDPGPEVPRI